MQSPLQQHLASDPRRLRELVTRAEKLAQEHGLRSVLVGLSGFEGDPSFPGIIDYIESALRVDDTVFRMTRERVVLLLTDVDSARAEAILERLLLEYREQVPTANDPAVGIGAFEIGPDRSDHSLKHVLPVLFGAPPKPH